MLLHFHFDPFNAHATFQVEVILHFHREETELQRKQMAFPTIPS